jgi:glycosyltransferase involved in cell wall biosynthesis
MSTEPFVSVVCPTHGRVKFLPHLLHFRSQIYPRDRLELLVLDDSEVPTQLFEGDASLRYFAKRNRLNKLSKGEIIVCFDDDYYGPDRVRLAVNALTKSGSEFGGTADVLYYFPRLQRFVRFNNKICAAAMFYSRDYGNSHAFLEGRRHGAESSFRTGKNIVVLANDKSFVAIGHSANTVSKRLVARFPAQPEKAEDLFPPDYLAFLRTL